MATGKGRETGKAQQWRRWVQEQRASGMTVRAFCRRRRLAEPSFYAWRRQLDRRDAISAAFVPVHVVVDEAQRSAGTLDVMLSGGRRVRVAPGFDAQTLQRLLAVLEEKPC